MLLTLSFTAWVHVEVKWLLKTQLQWHLIDKTCNSCDVSKSSLLLALHTARSERFLLGNVSNHDDQNVGRGWICDGLILMVTLARHRGLKEVRILWTNLSKEESSLLIQAFANLEVGGRAVWLSATNMISYHSQHKYKYDYRNKYDDKYKCDDISFPRLLFWSEHSWLVSKLLHFSQQSMRGPTSN